jgi:hypothetical protein
MKRLKFLMLGMFAVAVVGVPADAQLFQGQYGEGNTWNLYEVVRTRATWWAAEQNAQSKTQMGVSGHLVSIHSAAENMYVHNLGIRFGGDDDAWIGVTDREGAAPQVNQHGALSPQESIALEGIGCCDSANAKTLGWAWTSGEPFTYSNWANGEPNNWDGAGPAAPNVGYEDVAQLWPAGDWNDAAGGFGVDQPVAPTLQPGSSTDESGGRAGSLIYVIEYNTKAAAAFPNIPIPEPSSITLGLFGLLGLMGWARRRK